MAMAYGVWDARGDHAAGFHVYDHEATADGIHAARVRDGIAVPGEHVSIECGCWVVSGWSHAYEDDCPGWKE